MAYKKAKTTSSDSRKSGASMGRETSSGRQGFSAWMIDKFMGFVSCTGSISDEVMSNGSLKGVVTLKWYNSGVKQTETCFYSPDKKTFNIPEWGFWGSFKASNNQGFFGRSIKNDRRCS